MSCKLRRHRAQSVLSSAEASIVIVTSADSCVDVAILLIDISKHRLQNPCCRGSVNAFVTLRRPCHFSSHFEIAAFGSDPVKRHAPHWSPQLCRCIRTNRAVLLTGCIQKLPCSRACSSTSTNCASICEHLRRQANVCAAPHCMSDDDVSEAVELLEAASAAVQAEPDNKEALQVCASAVKLAALLAPSVQTMRSCPPLACRACGPYAKQKSS